MMLTPEEVRKLDTTTESIDQRLAEAFEKLYLSIHTIEEIQAVVEEAQSDLEDLKNKIDDHDCWRCRENARVEYVEIRPNRDDERYHEAVETNYQVQRTMCERMFPEAFQCALPGCNGTLWAEYIENCRYLVKCSKNCRIIWTIAPNPREALEENAAPKTHYATTINETGENQ